MTCPMSREERRRRQKYPMKCSLTPRLQHKSRVLHESPRCDPVHMSREPHLCSLCKSLIQCKGCSAEHKQTPTALFLFSERGRPAPKVSVSLWVGGLSWARISCKHTSSTTPRGGLSIEPGGRESQGSLPLSSFPSAWLGCPRFCRFIFSAAEPHTEAITIMRWGEMLEMLARRSGARRER